MSCFYTTMVHTDAGYYTPVTPPSGAGNPTYEHIWYLKDHLGNNRVLADGNGNSIAVNDYDPFGESIQVTSSSGVNPFPLGATESPYKYGGKEWNEWASTYDFEARYHSPSFHRFTTMDPLAEKYYSISPYAYCAGNPVNLVDLDGYSPQLVGALGGALVGGIVGGGIALFEGKRGREFWGAVGGGAVSGAIIGVTGGVALFGEGVAAGILEGTITGAIGGASGSIAEQLIVDQPVDWEKVAYDTTSGALAGAASGFVKSKVIDKIESSITTSIEEKYASKETVTAIRNEVKNELKNSGQTTGYRNRSLIDNRTTSRINTMKSAEEYLVNKTVDAVNEAQKLVNNWWIGNVGTNLYEQYGY